MALVQGMGPPPGPPDFPRSCPRDQGGHHEHLHVFLAQDGHELHLAAVATALVRDGQAQAVVSAGNTGAVMASAFLYLGRIRGVERPAIGTLMIAPPLLVVAQ